MKINRFHLQISTQFNSFDLSGYNAIDDLRKIFQKKRKRKRQSKSIRFYSTKRQNKKEKQQKKHAQYKKIVRKREKESEKQKKVYVIDRNCIKR